MQAEGTATRMFPVGLYGLLLLALAGIAFPGLFDGVEKHLRTVVCLPLRAYSVVFDGQPVLAAERAPEGADRRELREVLSRRVAAAGSLVPDAVPQVVLVREQRRGRDGRVESLVLGIDSGSLRGARGFVTFGRALLGELWLDPDASRPAQVRLLSWRPANLRRSKQRQAPGAPAQPARTAAEYVSKNEADSGRLRFLVEPARPVDDWPLRCVLLDDPYFASRLRASGGLVRTAHTADREAPPPGLEIGRLQIWGYPRLDIPVGLFVEPSYAGESLPAVCLWWPAGARAAPSDLRPQGRRVAVQITRYPAPRPAFERWLLTCEAGLELPDGAALVQGDYLLGWLQRPWSGQSLVSPLGRAADPMNLMLWDGAQGLRLLRGRVTGRAADGRLRLATEQRAELFAGRLYTSCNGRHGPSGLCLGEVSVAGPQELLLRLPELQPSRAEVFVGSGGLQR